MNERHSWHNLVRTAARVTISVFRRHTSEVSNSMRVPISTLKQCYIFRFPLSANSGHSYEFSSVSYDGEYGNEDAEKRALETEKKRYVDDVFCIVKT